MTKHSARQFLLLCTFVATLNVADAQESNIPASLVPQIQQILEVHRVPGVSISVVTDNRIAWSGGVGVANAEDSNPVNRSTLFQAASVSKPVTAFAVLTLVEDGTFELDTTLEHYMTSVDFLESDSVTLRQLLSHTAGLNISGFRGYRQGEDVPKLRDIILGQKPANNGTIRQVRDAGEKYKYSGGGYCLVQQAVIDTIDRPFAEVVRDRVLAPLNMKDSVFTANLPSHLQVQAATGHTAKVSPIPGKWHSYPELAAAGLWTTADDLARFIIGVQTSHSAAEGAILKPELARDMLTAQIEDGPTGLGFFTHDPDAGIFSHSGSNQGFRCLMLASKNPGTGVVIMTNGAYGGKVFTPIQQIVETWRSTQ